MGSIYKRGNKFWIQYYSGGECHRESAGTASKKEAKAILTLKESEVIKGEAPILNHQKIQLSEVFDDLAIFYYNNGHKAAIRPRYARKSFLSFFGESALVKDITPQTLDQYITHRKELGKGNATTNRELALLRKALNLAREHGKVSRIPKMPHLRIANQTVHPFRSNPSEESTSTGRISGMESIFMVAQGSSILPSATFGYWLL